MLHVLTLGGSLNTGTVATISGSISVTGGSSAVIVSSTAGVYPRGMLLSGTGVAAGAVVSAVTGTYMYSASTGSLTSGTAWIRNLSAGTTGCYASGCKSRWELFLRLSTVSLERAPLSRRQMQAAIASGLAVVETVPAIIMNTAASGSFSTSASTLSSASHRRFSGIQTSQTPLHDRHSNIHSSEQYRHLCWHACDRGDILLERDGGQRHSGHDGDASGPRPRDHRTRSRITSPATLYIRSGGLIVNANNPTVTSTLNFGAPGVPSEAFIHIANGQTLTVNGSYVATGIAKDGLGTLKLGL
jgi:hypothetical protein